jgi:pilus assembly protein CpaF
MAKVTQQRTAAPSTPDATQAAALGGMTSPAVLAPSLRLQGALSTLMERLATHMNVARSEESAFPSEHQATLERLIDELAEEGALGPDLDRRFLREVAISEAVGLGPLDRLLGNRAVREIVVDGPTRVLADLGGGLTSVSAFFSDDSAVLVVARRLLHRAGQQLDSQIPIHHAQLPGGGMLQLLLPPLSPKGALISVRCPPRAQSSPEGLVTDGVLSGEMLSLLRGCVQQRKNILVVGPMAGGISSMLALLTSFVPDHERVVSIENAPSHSLQNPHVLPLSRNALPEASLSELLQSASQLRYDRLVIDDVRNEETLTALSSAAGGGGVSLGMHAANPQVALSMLELFAQSALAGSGRGLKALMGSALQLIVHVGIDNSGTRRLLEISELRHTHPDTLELRNLFRYDGKAFVGAESRASFLGS